MWRSGHMRRGTSPSTVLRTGGDRHARVTKKALAECEDHNDPHRLKTAECASKIWIPRTASDMGPNPPDAEVVARVLRGDLEAFALLVDRYQDEFTAYAKHMTGSADEAADIVQESLVRAYRSLRRCGDPDRFKGWLFRIVSNQCKTHVTRRKRREKERIDDVAYALRSPHEADADAREAELRQQLEDALQELPSDQREALVLKYIQELSIEEMAEMVGASSSALKMRLKRGREALREKLEGVVV